jgi:hypothetical protein
LPLIGRLHYRTTWHRDFILHNIEAAIVDHDIFIVLDHEMKSIRQEWSLGDGWPMQKRPKRLSSQGPVSLPRQDMVRL